MRPCVAKTRHADGNNVRFNLLEAFVIHPPVTHDTRAEVVDHHIRNLDQLLRDLTPAWVRHVDNRALLATEKIASKPTASRAKIKRISSFNLNNLGSLIRKNTRRYRPGNNPGEIKNADTI